VAAILLNPRFPLHISLANYGAIKENLFGWCRIGVLHKASAMFTMTAERET